MDRNESFGSVETNHIDCRTQQRYFQYCVWFLFASEAKQLECHRLLHPKPLARTDSQENLVNEKDVTFQ